jgi:transposase
LYESTPGATLKGIAADLGIVRGTLRHWVDLYGTGKTTAADGTTSIRPMRAGGGGAPVAGPETPEQELSRLRARVRELEVETTKLTTEREIPQRAAKYFAGETNW